MKKFLFGLLIGLFVLSGCSNEEEMDKIPEFVEVEIKIPEVITVNEEVTFEAIVTQGKEKVEDAAEVKFEIAKAGQEKGEQIEAKHQGQGVYSINKTFNEAGDYSIISHVTARDLHTMPKREFRVQ